MERLRMTRVGIVLAMEMLHHHLVVLWWHPRMRTAIDMRRGHRELLSTWLISSHRWRRTMGMWLSNLEVRGYSLMIVGWVHVWRQ